ncbi:MAG: hypothetical protein ABJE66_23090 [Deltaproteobacteria bacterium]
MRIGDLLLAKGLVRASDLARAVAEQPGSGRRLCSILIIHGALDFDDAARALGEQRGCPCALAKHLANRDAALTSQISAELGRVSNVLPIGRTSSGTMIVAARDPAPALRATLEKLLGPVTLVITPASRLDQMISAAYGAAPHDEFDIDLDSAVDLQPLWPDASAPVMSPPPADVDMLDPDSIRMALSDLDDERVSKDPTQSGLLQVNAMASASSASIKMTGTRTNTSGAFRLPDAAPTIAKIELALEQAATRDAASDVAMSFVAGRWRTGAIVVIRDGTAIGYRGHGIADLAELHLPLRLASTIQRAFETKQLANSSPPSPAQDQLVRVLRASVIAAAPVVVADNVIAVIATGDSILGAADTNAHAELGKLAHALGAAYDRIHRA